MGPGTGDPVLFAAPTCFLALGEDCETPHGWPQHCTLTVAAGLCVLQRQQAAGRSYQSERACCLARLSCATAARATVFHLTIRSHAIMAEPRDEAGDGKFEDDFSVSEGEEDYVRLEKGNDDGSPLSEEEEEGEESGDENMTPFGANEENLELDRAVKKGNRELLEVESAVEQNVSRVKVMGEHLKNVQQELQHTQALLTMRQREAESEVHLQLTAEKELGRTVKEKAALETQLKELQDKMNINQNSIFTTREKLQAIKEEMHWDQQEMQA